MGIDAALALVRETGDQPVPLHLRNAPTSLMKEMGYGRDYKYPHDWPGHFTIQQYMPDTLGHRQLWTPADNPAEMKAAELQTRRWGATADNQESGMAKP